MGQKNIPGIIISAQCAIVFIFFIQIRIEYQQPHSLTNLLVLSLIAIAVLSAAAGLYFRSRIARIVASLLLIYVGFRGFYLFHGMYQLIKPIDLIETFVFGILNLAHAYCIYLAIALFLSRQAKLYFSSERI